MFLIRHANVDPNRQWLTPKDPATFIGYNDDGIVENTATQTEFDIANQKLHEFFLAHKVKEEQKPGTKLYCYDLEPIEYTNPDGTPFILSHSFTNIEMRDALGNKILQVFAIDPYNKYLIDENSHEGKNISQAHWQYAKKELAKKNADEKLYSHRKVKNNLGIAHCFIVLLAAIDIDGIIQFIPVVFAMNGNGWKNEIGSFSIHKSLVNEKGELFDLKIARKYKCNSTSMQDRLEVEKQIAYKAGILISDARKKTGLRPNLFLTQLYQTDFSYFIRRSIEKINAQKTASGRKLLRKQSKIQFATILLQMAIDLEKLHAMGIIHRDIKPSNVLVNYSLNRKPLARLIDFGFAKFLLPRGCEVYWGLSRTGTREYIAPEINTNESSVPYTKQSDIWALGVIFLRINESFGDVKSQHLDPTFQLLGTRATTKNPENRLHLAYIQLELLRYLSVKTNTPLEALLAEYNFPIKTVMLAQLLSTFFNEALEIDYCEFASLSWIEILKQLEADLASNDFNKKRNAEAVLDFYLNVAVASPNTLRSIFLIYFYQPLFEFSEAWFSAFIARCKTLDENVEKINNLYWLYDSSMNDLQLSHTEIHFPLETLWGNEIFWNQLAIHIKAHNDADKQEEENIIALLEKTLGKEPGTLYAIAAANELPSSPVRGL